MFSGFSDKTTDFLWGIRFNNDREWFTEHKQEYLDYVQTPLKELATECFDAFIKKHPKAELNLHISRIYRDARRLFGRGPYKDHLWFSFRSAAENWAQTPVMWFEINPEGYAFGLGVYAAPPAMMARFRKALDARPRSFVALANSLKAQSRFVLRGEEYAKKKGNPAPPLDEWYNRKTIDIVCQRKIDRTLNSPAIRDELIEAYDYLFDFYKFFDKIEHSTNE
jgi:uncharacterized protein (TIGR02453 family)